MSQAPAPRPAIRLDPLDNVATALVALSAGRQVSVGGAVVRLRADVPAGHKFACRAIAAGEPVVKYGQPIGLATAPVAPGEHVHTHNHVSQRAGGRRG